MASPFRTFRKNQKLWMAGITIMAIIAFVFLSGPIANFGGGGRQQVVMKTTKFGNLTSNRVDVLRNQRHMLERFRQSLRQYWTAAGQPELANQITFGDLLVPDEYAAIIERWLYAREAESLGISIDDKTINDTLSMMTNNLNRDELLKVLRPVELTESQIFAILREQLLALRLMQVSHAFDGWTALSATPSERWEYFKRLHEKASVELAVLSPKDFVQDVKDPTLDELTAYLDAHAKVEANPNSPTPGFKVPRKVDIAYLEADREKYVALVTDAEITEKLEKNPKIYERDRERFQKEEKEEKAVRERLEKEEADKEKKKPESKPDAKPETKPDDKPKAENAEKPKDKPETKPETKPEVKPESGKDAAPAKAAEPEKTAPPAPKPAGNSAADRASPFRLVAFADEKKDENKSKDSVKPDEKKPDEKKPEEKKPDEKKPEEKKPDEKKPEEKKPDARPKTREPIKTAEERLREQVRKEIADERFEENIAKIIKLLKRYSTVDPAKTTLPDFSALASEFQMTAHRTGLLSMRELADTDLGKSVNYEKGRLAFQLAFGRPALHQVETTATGLMSPLTQKRLTYIFWKTQDQAEHDPSLKDPQVEREVRDAWKLEKARELAVQTADKLAKEAAGQPEKSLKDLSAGKKLAGGRKDVDIQTPPEFSWMTVEVDNAPPELSKVGDLKRIGPGFMETVFTLRPGQSGVAKNLPETEIYVIRLIGFTSYDDLWKSFTSDDTAKDPFMQVLARGQLPPVSQAWRERIIADAGVEGGKIPTHVERPSEPSGPPPTLPDFE